MSSYLLKGEPWMLGYRTVGIIQFCLVAVLFASLPLWQRNAAAARQTPAEEHASSGLRQLLSLPGLKQMLVVFFCYCTIETVTGLWGASYLVTVRNISPENAARWIALYYLGITAGRLLSGFLSIKMTNRQMVRAGQGLIAGGIVMLLLPLDSTLLSGLFMIGLGCAPIFPSLLHETPQNFGREYSQAVMGVQMASAYIGTTLMPPLFGQVANLLDFSILPMFIGVVLITKIIMTEIVNKKAGLSEKN
jgi:fucose permease